MSLELQEVTLEGLVADLRVVARSGNAPVPPADVPTLTGLQLVGVRAYSKDPIDIGVAIQAFIEESCNGLGEGPAAQAIRSFFGIGSSRGLRLQDRRDLAADRLGVKAASWRKDWEAPMVSQLATAIYSNELEARVIVHVKPGSPASKTTITDLGRGKGGKNLGRRRDEARVFASGYFLRAEVFNSQDLIERGASPDEIEASVVASLRLFARFSEEFAVFVSKYGTGIVMAGNEVTAREAAQLLSFRPPLEDQDITFLRIVGGAETSLDDTEFQNRLQARDPDRARRIIQRWTQALK